jgi:ABC-2 type transport system permease protein
MSDIGVVVWKEWRELLGQRGLRGKSGLLLNLAVFGVLLPLQFGAQWITSPLIPLAWSWVPMFFVMMVIADAVAGERERHTLETLLASRLSDRAILFGKLAAAVGYALGITLASLVLGLIAVNVVFARGGLLLYPATTLFAIVVGGLLGAVFVAAGGVFISLRAATVRQAEQTMGGAIMLVMFGPVLILRVLPAGLKERVAMTPISGALLAIGGMGLLAAIDVALIALAMRRFERSRLVVSS